MQDTPKQYNPMQQVKRNFFAMRNGVVADVLRRAGSPYRIIFGLNLPQIVDIAYETEHTRELAEQLWANTTTRESMLMAPMLMPFEEFGADDARRWAAEVPDVECADILCHRLLRHLDFAIDLAKELSTKSGMERYVGARLGRNLAYSEPKGAMEAALAVLSRGGEDAAARVAAETISEIKECGLEC